MKGMELFVTVPDADTCPFCTGELCALGILGNLAHLTCRDCGVTVRESVVVQYLQSIREREV